MLGDKTDRTWLSRFLRHPAKKRNGSTLTTPEPARGYWAEKEIWRYLQPPG